MEVVWGILIDVIEVSNIDCLSW